MSNRRSRSSRDSSSSRSSRDSRSSSASRDNRSSSSSRDNRSSSSSRDNSSSSSSRDNRSSSYSRDNRSSSSSRDNRSSSYSRDNRSSSSSRNNRSSSSSKDNRSSISSKDNRSSGSLKDSRSVNSAKNGRVSNSNQKTSNSRESNISSSSNKKPNNPKVSSVASNDKKPSTSKVSNVAGNNKKATSNVVNLIAHTALSVAKHPAINTKLNTSKSGSFASNNKNQTSSKVGSVVNNNKKATGNVVNLIAHTALSVAKHPAINTKLNTSKSGSFASNNKNQTSSKVGSVVSNNKKTTGNVANLISNTAISTSRQPIIGKQSEMSYYLKPNSSYSAFNISNTTNNLGRKQVTNYNSQNYLYAKLPNYRFIVDKYIVNDRVSKQNYSTKDFIDRIKIAEKLIWINSNDLSHKEISPFTGKLETIGKIKVDNEYLKNNTGVYLSSKEDAMTLIGSILDNTGTSLDLHSKVYNDPVTGKAGTGFSYISNGLKVMEINELIHKGNKDKAIITTAEVIGNIAGGYVFSKLPIPTKNKLYSTSATTTATIIGGEVVGDVMKQLAEKGIALKNEKERFKEIINKLSITNNASNDLTKLYEKKTIDPFSSIQRIASKNAFEKDVFFVNDIQKIFNININYNGYERENLKSINDKINRKINDMNKLEKEITLHKIKSLIQNRDKTHTNNLTGANKLIQSMSNFSSSRETLGSNIENESSLISINGVLTYSK